MPANDADHGRDWPWPLKWLVVPGVVYFTFFAVFTWPWIARFNSHFSANDQDGLQNVWNVWWVDRAVTHLHQSPWHTTLLHAPHGTTLLGQTMNPFNGFVAIPLLRAFNLVQTFNLLVIFSFIAAGITAALLCHEFSQRYVPSLIGGFVFTFSAYHLASANGLMQLVSLEWIPLFLLLWWRLLERPTYPIAIGAAISILLVLLCDYYYFLYALAGAVLVAAYLWRTRVARASRPLATWAVLFIATSLVLPLQLVVYNHGDKFLGAHDSRLFSADVVATFVDGGLWRWGSLTDSIWRHIHGFPTATTVYLGATVIVVIAIAIVQRKRLHPDTSFWLAFAGIFWIFSLGPRLKVYGRVLERVPLPYAVLERLIPPLKLGGTPYRLIVMVTLAAAVLTSIVLARVDVTRRRGQLAVAAFALALVLEMWPATLASTRATHPRYVDALRALTRTGAVFDAAAPDQNWQLYYQTIHEKPLALGYISRVPTSVAREDARITDAIEHRRFAELCVRFGLRYYTAARTDPIQPTAFRVVFRDDEAAIYDLKTSAAC